MERTTDRHLNLKSVAAAVALVIAGVAASGQANAGCGDALNGASKLQGRAALETARLIPASYAVEDDAAIVGFWKFSFTAKGNAGIPDGAPIDAGYATWHSDGTELMNSGRAPVTGSFCMGTWKQIGRSTFKLNHFALAWDPTGTVLVGPANIREVVTVDKTGNHYSGTFVLTQYSTDETTILARVTGTIAATRITAD